MFASTLLLAALPLLASASPITSRAGGPTAIPIPANCTVINPLPHASCGTGNVNGWQPQVATDNFIFSAYFGGTGSAASQADFCFQQCHGYLNCVSAVLAQNVPTPKGYYGSEGGELSTACLFYDIYLNPNDFVPAPEGQWLNATAASIYCPAE